MLGQMAHLTMGWWSSVGYGTKIIPEPSQMEGGYLTANNFLLLGTGGWATAALAPGIMAKKEGTAPN
jgi:hypothetical protein